MKAANGILFYLLLGLGTQVAVAQNSFSAGGALDFWISNTEKEIMSAAEAMPEEKYSFRPAAGEFTGVRTFGEQIKHLAANNYRMAAYILGQEPSPDQEHETGPTSVQTKAQIVDYAKGSFAALHRAAGSINDKNMLEPVLGHTYPRQNTRLQFAVDAVAHSNDHYGQMVEYLRMNGLIPSESRK